MRMRKGLVWLWCCTGLMTLAHGQASADPNPRIELEPPISAELPQVGNLPLIVLSDTTGRRLCFTFDRWCPCTIRPDSVLRPARILIGGCDPANPPSQPLPIWGDSEAALLQLALPALSAAAAERESLWAHPPRTQLHGDTVEVHELRPEYDRSPSSPHYMKQVVQWRLEEIEAARRGDVGPPELALRFYPLRPPLRVRSLRWNRWKQEWTFVVEDSAKRESQLLVPKHAGKRSARWVGSTKLAFVEGTFEDCATLLAAQMALRADNTAAAPSPQHAAALSAIRARMARILAVYRQD